MDPMARVSEAIAPALAAMGFDLVRVKLSGGQRPVLQVMAERGDGSMSVEDCAEVSRAVSAILDVEDPIAGAYTLEVSSPGLDRPLVRPADYERFKGHEARLDLAAPLSEPGPLAGRKRLKGRLLGCTAEGVRLEMEEGEIGVPFGAIASAKLLLTDALIAAALKRQG